MHEFEAKQAAALLREHIQKLMSTNLNDDNDDNTIKVIKQAAENVLNSMGMTHVVDLTQHVDVAIVLHPDDSTIYTIMFKPLSLTGARIIHEWYQVLDMMEIMRT